VDSGVLTKTEESFVWEQIKKHENFWLGTRPYVENVNALSGFLARVNFAEEPVSVFYITSRIPTEGMSVLKQTRLWLDMFNLHRNNTSILPVFHSNNSGGLPPKRAIVESLGLDAMIDDYAPTVESLGSSGWLLDRPWNRDAQNARSYENPIQVVTSLEEFLAKFEPVKVRTALPI
jgi:hypothetical protein